MKSFTTLLLLLAGAAHADDHWCDLPRAHPLDAALAVAMEASGGVTVDMHDAQGVALDGRNAELNRIYRKVMQQFGDGVRAITLRDAQRAWLAWDRAETRSDLAQQAEGGSSGPLMVTALATQRRRARACTLHDMQGTP